jgi:hypothetical protein
LKGEHHWSRLRAYRVGTRRTIHSGQAHAAGLTTNLTHRSAAPRALIWPGLSRRQRSYGQVSTPERRRGAPHICAGHLLPGISLIAAKRYAGTVEGTASTGSWRLGAGLAGASA